MRKQNESNAHAMRTHTQSDAHAMQSKVKESKVNKIKDSIKDIAKEVASATTPPPPPDVVDPPKKEDPLRARALAIVEDQ